MPFDPDNPRKKKNQIMQIAEQAAGKLKNPPQQQSQNPGGSTGTKPQQQGNGFGLDVI